jgi:hypothetical protein
MGRAYVTKHGKRSPRTRADTYVDEDQRVCCRECRTDILYHEVTWWAVYDSVPEGAVYLDNRDADDGSFTCECKRVTWDLEI